VSDTARSPTAIWDPATPFGATLEAVDRAFEQTFAVLRGRRGLDAAAAVVSNLSDYGVIWPLVAVVKARRPAARGQAVAALGAAGVSSLLVNKALKAIFRRQRPRTAEGGTQHGLTVRTPRSSSFPSGHTLASFCTAVVLAEAPSQAVTFLGFASGVALSRIHLRAHHATDVLAGAAVGLGLGLVVRRSVRRLWPPVEKSLRQYLGTERGEE
jgi:membrane-associated phospholipid phosphatase